MKITIGEWKTERGDKWHIDYASDAGAVGHNYDGFVAMWNHEHHRIGYGREHSLVAPWIDPVPWDWSTTPPWLNCLIQGHSRQWYLCEAGVDIGNDGLLLNGSKSIPVPQEYTPKWSGNWRNSKTMRPGYKEGK